MPSLLIKLSLLFDNHHMEQLTSIEQYNSIVERYRRPGCLTNDYLQTRAAGLIAHGALQAECRGDNAYLLEAKDNCWRLYYYLNDLAVTSSVTTPDGRPIVAEILYRGNGPFPQAESDYLTAIGFQEDAIRDQYAVVLRDMASLDMPDGVVVRLARDLDEVAWACALFNETFDPYTGDAIAPHEYPAMLDNGQILVAEDTDGSRMGALHQSVERSVAWAHHLAVVPQSRGRRVGLALMYTFVKQNLTAGSSRCMLWTQRQNAAAVTMYKKIGYKYLNKSTLSLIKRTGD